MNGDGMPVGADSSTSYHAHNSITDRKNDAKGVDIPHYVMV